MASYSFLRAAGSSSIQCHTLPCAGHWDQETKCSGVLTGSPRSTALLGRKPRHLGEELLEHKGQLVHPAGGPLTPLRVSKAETVCELLSVFLKPGCQTPCLSLRRPSRLKEMSSARLCSGLTSPLLCVGTKCALIPSPPGTAAICVFVRFQNRGPRRKNHERRSCWKKCSGAHLIASLSALAEKTQEPRLLNVWVPRGGCKEQLLPGRPQVESALFMPLWSVCACACVWQRGRNHSSYFCHMAISTSKGQDNSYFYGSSDMSGHLTKKWVGFPFYR